MQKTPFISNYTEIVPHNDYNQLSTQTSNYLVPLEVYQSQFLWLHPLSSYLQPMKHNNNQYTTRVYECQLMQKIWTKAWLCLACWEVHERIKHCIESIISARKLQHLKPDCTVMEQRSTYTWNKRKKKCNLHWSIQVYNYTRNSRRITQCLLPYILRNIEHIQCGLMTVFIWHCESRSNSFILCMKQ